MARQVGARSVLELINHFRENSGDTKNVGAFIGNANCAHVEVELLGIGIGYEFEGVAAAVFCGGAGVFEEEAA